MKIGQYLAQDMDKGIVSPFFDSRCTSPTTAEEEVEVKVEEGSSVPFMRETGPEGHTL